MKRDHFFTWTPNSLNCAICGGGHHPWDDIGQKGREPEAYERAQQRQAHTTKWADEMRWMLC